MSIKDVPVEIIDIFSKAAKSLGGGSFHITPIRVCDHCKDAIIGIHASLANGKIIFT